MCEIDDYGIASFNECVLDRGEPGVLYTSCGAIALYCKCDYLYRRYGRCKYCGRKVVYGNNFFYNDHLKLNGKNDPRT